MYKAHLTAVKQIAQEIHSVPYNTSGVTRAQIDALAAIHQRLDANWNILLDRGRSRDGVIEIGLLMVVASKICMADLEVGVEGLDLDQPDGNLQQRQHRPGY